MPTIVVLIVVVAGSLLDRIRCTKCQSGDIVGSLVDHPGAQDANPNPNPPSGKLYVKFEP